MHIGILTGGGDCPGLNAVIRAATLALLQGGGARITGIERGFHGLLARRSRPLGEADVADILAQGGTILGTHNRCDPFDDAGRDRSAEALACARELGLDALLAIGGDGTMHIAQRFDALGLPVVGVAKTIDNDLLHTERSFGYDSAVAVVAEALDRLATTARSHGRVMIAETMGRHAGWIALAGGLAGGADLILLPELPFDIDAVLAHCRQRLARQGWALLCIAEGAHAAGEGLSWQQPAGDGATGGDAWHAGRLGGVAQLLQHRLQPQLGGAEVRATLLGHVQRGGTPTAYDRVLATQFGWHAAQLLRQGRTGRMVTLQGERCGSVELTAVAQGSRPVPLDHPLLETARCLGVVLG